jgi:hypothetical protein
MSTIRIAEHAPSPGGRYISDGPFSGEWFRNEILGPAVATALESEDKVKVELDGTAGYGSSFLEEAFGGLIRVSGLGDPRRVRETVVIIAKNGEASSSCRLTHRRT